MKKIISLFLSLTMLLSLTAGLDFSAYADTLTTGKCGENVTYSFDSKTGTLTISGTGDMYDYYSSNESVFYDNGEIKAIIMEKGVTSIGDSAFSYCKSLTSVTIPNSVTSIGSSAFNYCISLTSVTIPGSVTSIGDCAFDGCNSLANIIIPDSVTSIGDYAFENCTSLTSVTIPNSVTSIGDDAFWNCTSLTSINVEKNNKNYSSVNGVLFNQNQNKLICYPAGKNDKTYEIPNSVTSIGDSAFCFCTSLTSVTIPDSVTSIGNSAFYDCESLTSVTIPDSVTSIGDSAFRFCTSLTSVTIPDSVTSIGNSAFYDCESLTSVTIPDSVTSIGGYAFYYCTSLTSVTIPDSVTSIGENAFGSCESLAVAVILGNNVSIDSSAFNSGTLLLCKSSTKLKDREGFESQEIKYFDDASIVNNFSQFNYKTKELYGREGWNEDNVIYCFTANESRTYYSNSNIVFDEDFNLAKSKKIDRINDSTSRNQSKSEGYSFELVKGKKYYFINGIVIKDFVYCGDKKQYVGFDYNNYCKLKVIYPDDKSVDFNYITYKENLEQTQKTQFCGKIISFDLNNPVSFDSFEVLNGEYIDSGFLTALKKFDQKTLDKYPIIYRLHLTDGTVYDINNYTMQCMTGETKPDGNSCSSWDCITSDGKKVDIEFEYDNNCPDNLVIYIDDCGEDPYYKLNPSTVVNVNEHVHNWINGTIIKQTTCTDNGEKCYTCSICNATKTEVIKTTGHTYKQTVTPATTSKNGKIVKKCSACGATITSSIAKISTVSLSAVNYTYNGGVKTPSVTVKDSKGKKLSNGRDYTVTYPSGRKNVGRYSVKIRFKGNYSGTKTLTYNINPKGTSMSKVTAAKKGFKAKWKKQSTQTTGYQLQYSTSSKFKKGTKTVNISKNKTASKSVRKLYAKKKYYVRVRTYKTVKFGGKNIKLYSGWSKAKAVKTKK